MLNIAEIEITITTTGGKNYTMTSDQHGYWNIANDGVVIDGCESEHVGGYLAGIGAIPSPYMEKFMRCAVALGGEQPKEPDWMKE